jgi:hypothetical protein
MNTKTSTLALVLLGASLSGCGPNLVNDDRATNEMGVSGYYYGQNSDANYTCGATANILPVDDRVMDGTQRYDACANRNTPTKIKLIGYSSSSQIVCAFPVQFINSTQFLYKYDNYGQPAFQCYDAWANTDAGVELDYPQVATYNGVLVVDQGVRAQMSACLQTGQNCPPHSIGQFR